jgi:hypothetical protein
MRMDELWTIERDLWLAGVDAYETRMAPQCLMVFGPMGVMERGAILDAVRQAPRWSEVAFDQRQSIAPADDIAVLAYRATGSRDGAEPYRALCTSSYIRSAGRWLIAHHQQTPLDQKR